jgi:hypothetical protein
MNFYKSAPPEIRQQARGHLRAVVHAHMDALVETFYSVFLQHPEGHAFLDHEVVHQRLSGSMKGGCACWWRPILKMVLRLCGFPAPGGHGARA